MSQPGHWPLPDAEPRSLVLSAAVLRMIVGIQIFVVLGGATGALVWRGGGHWTGGQDLLLPGIVPVFGVCEAVGFLVLRMVISRSVRANWPPEDRLSAWGTYATLTLLGTAMATGVSAFGIVIFCISGHWLALLTAALFVLALLACFPTDGRFDRFVATFAGGETR